jgi:hypothetical protein
MAANDQEYKFDRKSSIETASVRRGDDFPERMNTGGNQQLNIGEIR